MKKRSGVIVCSVLSVALVAGCTDDSEDDEAFELNDLLGSTALQWQFRGEVQVFLAQATFTEQSIIQTDEGDPFLLGVADVSVRESADTGFVRDNQQTIGCFEVADSPFGQCIIAPDILLGAGIVLFFNPLDNGQAEGNFEFCVDLQDQAILQDCTLATFSPTFSDGQMLITNTTASAAASSLASAERDSTYNTFAIDTMRYLKQGTSSTDTTEAPVGSMDFTEVDGAAIVEKVRAIIASAK